MIKLPDTYPKLAGKADALRKLANVKEVLRLLNTKWQPRDIINEVYSNGKVWKREVHKPPVDTHFYFIFSQVNGFFWLHVTSYDVWSEEKFQTFVKVLQLKAIKDGYFFRVALVPHVGRLMELGRCRTNKELFIEVLIKVA